MDSVRFDELQLIGGPLDGYVFDATGCGPDMGNELRLYDEDGTHVYEPHWEIGTATYLGSEPYGF